MRNRAKCKKCNSIIESFHSTDLVFCSCGEIGLDGGSSLKCLANDLENIIRVDDEGNEIIPKIKNKEEEIVPQGKPSLRDLHEMLKEMINNIEKMPSHALSGPINHYDFLSALLLFSAFFKILSASEDLEKD